MATRSIVPRADGEGGLGVAAKRWGEVHTNNLHVGGERVRAFAGDRLEIVVDKSGSSGDFDNLDDAIEYARKTYVPMHHGLDWDAESTAPETWMNAPAAIDIRLVAHSDSPGAPYKISYEGANSNYNRIFRNMDLRICAHEGRTADPELHVIQIPGTILAANSSRISFENVTLDASYGPSNWSHSDHSRNYTWNPGFASGNAVAAREGSLIIFNNVGIYGHKWTCDGISVESASRCVSRGLKIRGFGVGIRVDSNSSFDLMAGYDDSIGLGPTGYQDTQILSSPTTGGTDTDPGALQTAVFVNRNSYMYIHFNVYKIDLDPLDYGFAAGHMSSIQFLSIHESGPPQNINFISTPSLAKYSPAINSEGNANSYLEDGVGL